MKTTNTTIMKIAALVALCCAAACSTHTTASSADSNARQSETRPITHEAEVETAETVLQPKKAEAETERTDEPATSSTATPAAVYRAAYAARKNKDIPALKRFLSKDALEFMSIFLEDGQTIDDALRKMTETPQAATDASRNEKISGERATLEYPDGNGKWKTMDFVKEDGAWKITMPKADSRGAGKMAKMK